MKTVRITIPEKSTILIGDTHRQRGDVIQVPDSRAADLIRHGNAEAADGAAVTNPEANHLGDAIEPMPPLDATGRPAMTTGGTPHPENQLTPDPEKPGLVELDRAVKGGRPKGVATPNSNKA